MKTPLYLFIPMQIKRKDHTLELTPKVSDFSFDSPMKNYAEELREEQFELDEEEVWWQGTPKRVPVQRISAIYVLSEADFNNRLLTFLSSRHIPVHFFSYYGYYSGSYLPRDRMPNGKVLAAQVRLYDSPTARLHSGKKLIDAAMYNMRYVVRYYHRLDGGYEHYSGQMEAVKKDLAQATSLEQLRAVEGRYRKWFYAFFDACSKSSFQLKGRSYHPPNNPANALISFLNSMLYTAVLGELYRTQLNPTIGWVHETGRHQFPLAYDLAELFRPLLVEQTALSLIRRHIVKPEDFEESLKGVLLNRDGRYKVSRAFESRMRRTVRHPRLDRNVSYRYLLRLEAYKLMKYLREGACYEAFTIWW